MSKAIYRTRMAIKDGGTLVVMGPNVKKFGEDEHVDQLIRKCNPPPPPPPPVHGMWRVFVHPFLNVVVLYSGVPPT